ncbi:MAG: GDYXXLXY domain-containing protein [Piscinibacter sp.]|uniref:GDYXXLXY domain-containing protein n=1 Tax=Piscinibacter sp. TaxID=1903157 RepID=UPI003D0FF40E
MSTARLDAVLRAARAQGLLPENATPPRDDARPWPVVLLTALGAWLAAIPLLAVVGMLLGDLISRSVGPYVVGALLIAGAVVVLRSRDVPLFVEQLAVPALLVGGGSLGFGLFRDAGTDGGAALLALVAMGVAAVIRSAWLRVLLGAAAAVLIGIALTPQRWRFGRGESLEQWWLAWHLLLAGWLVALQALRALRGHAAAALESTAAGWSLALLAGLAWWSGMTFLVGGTLGGELAGEIVRELGRRGEPTLAWRGMQALSALLALAGLVLAARRWRGLRRAPFVGAGLVLVALGALMPSLGATLLMLAWLATSGRLRLAAAAAVAAAWIVGAFYYQLAWPLATKAALLASAGALLAALAAWARAGRHATQPPARPDTQPRFPRAGIALALAAILAVANLGIRDKEALIREGRPVFVELAPVDPRSLMQGDFMRINFNVPGAPGERRIGMLRRERPFVVARRDERGIAQLQRVDDGTPLAEGELRIQLTPKDGRWILVSDAWFFAEGEAARWEKARYGEFRVDADGRALLVGLRGAALEAL